MTAQSADFYWSNLREIADKYKVQLSDVEAVLNDKPVSPSAYHHVGNIYIALAQKGLLLEIAA